MQTTLLGFAIAFILALLAALIGPYFIDWNQFRPQFEAEATSILGTPVRVTGALDARLLPTPSLQLNAVTIGGPNDLGRIRADRLSVEFSLGSLMRGEWRANELSVGGLALDLGLDPQGRVDWPTGSAGLGLGSLSVDKLNLTGRVALHDASSRGTLELSDIAFSGEVRSLASAIRGDGNFTMAGIRHPFRVSTGQTSDRNGTRTHLTVENVGSATTSADADGVLTFKNGVPFFDGGLLAVKSKKTPADSASTPWRLSSKVKVNPAQAKFDQLEFSYGGEDAALRFSGNGDAQLGASPQFHAALALRQFDADKLMQKDDSDTTRLQRLRATLANIPSSPVAAKVELTAEQIILGGRPLQNISADLRAEPTGWAIDRLEFQAPGSSRVALNGAVTPVDGRNRFSGKVTLDSSEPAALGVWLQGGDNPYRSDKPFHLSGAVMLADRELKIDGLAVESDAGNVEGKLDVVDLAWAGSTSIDMALGGERLDLDAVSSLFRTFGGSGAAWPDQAKVALDVGTAISNRQELRPLKVKLGYDATKASIDQLHIGAANGLTIDGGGSFNRQDATGRIDLTASSATFAQVADVIAPFAPAAAERINVASNGSAGRFKLAVDLTRDASQSEHANARAVLDIDSAQLKGNATISAAPAVNALRTFDLDALLQSRIELEAKGSSTQGRTVLALLGLDRIMTAGNGPATFSTSVSGAWRAPFKIAAKIAGAEIDAEAAGSAELWASPQTGSANVTVRRANIAPLLGLASYDQAAQNVSLTSRISLNGEKIAFDDLDGSVSGSRLRGHVAVTSGEKKTIDGDIGLDSLSIAPAFAVAIGAAGHNSSEPVTGGMLSGWQGRLSFQSLRGILPGGGELRPFGGTIKADGQALTFDNLKGGLGGGGVSASVESRQTSDGIAISGRGELTNVDGAALHYRGLAMPTGRVSMKATLATQGRSSSALSGALAGSGSFSLRSMRIDGLNPQSFDVAVRASDNGQAADDSKLRDVVEPALRAGALSVASAEIPFNIRDGRVRAAATLDGEGARALISGGYDIAADQTDLRVTLTSTALGSGASHPELQIFAVGAPDHLDRSIDVSALSSWLAVRAIDRETRRLDAIERSGAPLNSAPRTPATGENPTAAITPASPMPDVPAQNREPRRTPVQSIPITRAPVSSAPFASQQVAPLPPPIEVRPPPRPRPRPPMVLTPQTPVEQ